MEKKYSFINFCKKTIDDINYRFPESKKFQFSLNKYVFSMEFFEAIVAFNINRNLCNSKNEVLYTKGENIDAKFFSHIQNENIPKKPKRHACRAATSQLVRCKQLDMIDTVQHWWYCSTIDTFPVQKMANKLQHRT